MNPVDVMFLYRPDFVSRQAVIGKKAHLTGEEFVKFLEDPSMELPRDAESKSVPQTDTGEVRGCLLVTGEGRRDGVLVEPDGCGHARYAAYVPDVAALEYDSLSEFGAALSKLADRMILERTDSTREGNRIFYFDKIREMCGLSFSENPALAELLADMLVERPEVKQVNIRGGCLELRFHPDQCLDCGEETRDGRSLADLLSAGETADLYLVHKEDVGFVPVGMLNDHDLKPEALEIFSDLLRARVAEIREGAYGKEVELEGVSAERLKELDRFLAALPENPSVKTGISEIKRSGKKRGRLWEPA